MRGGAARSAGSVPSRDRLRGAGRLLGWGAVVVALWALALPVSWAVLAGGAVLLGLDVDLPLGGLAFSHVFSGWLQLLFAVPALAGLGRSHPQRYRSGAIIICLVLGSLLGTLLVFGYDEPAVAVLVGAWLLLGAVVPRPPART